MIQVWGKEYPDSPDFKEAIDRTVIFFKRFDIEKLLSDTRAQPLASKKSVDYAASVVDELIKNGMKKMAFVMSENLIVKHGVNNFKSAASHADIQYFENMEKASKWLDSEE